MLAKSVRCAPGRRRGRPRNEKKGGGPDEARRVGPSGFSTCLKKKKMVTSDNRPPGRKMRGEVYLVTRERAKRNRSGGKDRCYLPILSFSVTWESSSLASKERRPWREGRKKKKKSQEEKRFTKGERTPQRAKITPRKAKKKSY